MLEPHPDGISAAGPLSGDTVVFDVDPLHRDPDVRQLRLGVFEERADLGPTVVGAAAEQLDADGVVRQIAKYASIDEYISAIPEPLGTVAAQARRVIDANLTGADSAIGRAHPTWSFGKTPVCYLKAASKHITFGFWHGASIDDSSGRLKSSGEVMAHTKLPTKGDIDPALFDDWLEQARAIELDE